MAKLSIAKGPANNHGLGIGRRRGDAASQCEWPPVAGVPESSQCTPTDQTREKTIKSLALSGTVLLGWCKTRQHLTEQWSEEPEK